MASFRSDAIGPISAILRKYLAPNVLCFLAAWSAQGASPLDVSERHDQSWRISTFAQDAGLLRRNILDIAFESDGTAWLATSDGLVRYDGYGWRRYGIEDGLPSLLVRCVTVDRSGKLWVGTDRGAGVFDGYRFEPRGSETGLAGPSVRRIIEDEDGTLWFCSDQWPAAGIPAGLASMKDGLWTAHHEEDGLPSDHVFSYMRDSRGRQFVMTLKGTARKAGSRWQTVPAQDKEFLAWSMAETPQGDLIGLDYAPVCILRNDQWETNGSLPLRGRQAPPLCALRDGALVTCIHDGEQIAFYEFVGNEFVKASAPVQPQFQTIESVREAPDGSVWSVGRGLIARWERRGGEWTEFPDLPHPTLCDRENRIWFAQPEGMIRFTGAGFETLDLGGSGLHQASGAVWTWDNTRVARCSEPVASFGEPQTGLRFVRGCTLDSNGRLWCFGRNRAQQLALAEFDGSEWRSHQFPELGRQAPVQCSSDNREGLWLMLESTNSPRHLLAHFDGTRIETSPLPDLAIYEPRFHADPHGSVWVQGAGGFLRLADPTAGSWEVIPNLRDSLTLQILNHQGSVWQVYSRTFGGQGGYAVYLNGAWKEHPADADDFAVRTPQGTLYIGVNTGLHMVSPEGDEPMPFAVPGNFRVRSLVQGPGESLWLGVEERVQFTRSVLRYQPTGFTPRTVILELADKTRQDGKLRVRFAGLERYRPRSQSRAFLFSWRFDSEPWGPFQPVPEDGLSLGALGPGKHVLEVRARDHVQVDPKGARAEFLVTPIPIQERWWFVPSVLSAVGLVGFLAFLTHRRAREVSAANAALQEEVRERLRAEESLRAAQEDLERRVAERTALLSRANTELGREIEDRKKVQSALSRERDLLHSLMDNMPDHIFFKDAQRRIIRTNQAHLRALGLGCMEDALGKTDEELLPPDFAQRAKEEEQRIIESGQPVIGRVWQAPNASGELRWLSETKVPIFGDNGTVAGLVAVSRDITEQKRAEAELVALHRQLLEASRQAGMAEVATGVLHNVGNVLNSVNVSSSLLLDRNRKSKVDSLARLAALLNEHAADLGRFFTQDERGGKVPVFLAQLTEHLAQERDFMARELQSLHNNIDHIKEIVSTQQSYAMVSGVLQTLPLTELLDDAVRINAAALAKNDIKIVRDYEPLPPITVDKHKVLMILVNLLRNARHACEERSDGRVLLRLNRVEPDAARIEVQDNGVGIHPDNLTRIFAHGFTTRKHGHGFGLHAAALAARDMGGTLAARSEGVGQGATFTLILPLSGARNRNGADPLAEPVAQAGPPRQALP